MAKSVLILNQKIILRSGIQLMTLNDALQFIRGNFPGHENDLALVFCEQLILEAMRTRSPRDVEWATTQLRRFLKAERLI